VKTLWIPVTLGVAAAAAVLIVDPGASRGEDWFMPGQPHTAAPAAAPRSAHPARGERERAAPGLIPAQAGAAPTEPVAPGGASVQLPPVPQLPALPRGPSPPAAVIGVLGVPEVMRASTAAQQVEKVLGGRREKLNQDAQKEQAAWNELQKSLANDRPKLNADQIRTRERELQERITNAQKQFRDRNKIIQDAAQYALAQIERTLIAVIRQVSESRGMNLVLHRSQVALNVNEFDITQQVTEQLNKLLSSVNIPPDGQEPPLAANTPPRTAAGQAQVNTSPAEPGPAEQQPATAAEAAPPPAPGTNPSGPARK
jgi:Skp family chaperone for outer membrane proteins